MLTSLPDHLSRKFGPARPGSQACSVRLPDRLDRDRDSPRLREPQYYSQGCSLLDRVFVHCLCHWRLSSSFVLVRVDLPLGRFPGSLTGRLLPLRFERYTMAKLPGLDTSHSSKSI